MGTIFKWVYSFGAKNRLAFWLIVIAIFSTSVFLGLKIKFEEDITKVMPVNEQIVAINKVIDKSRIADRIVVNLSLKDSSAVNVPLLVQASENLLIKLNDLKPDLIEEVITGADDESAIKLIEFVQEYLPLFLDSDDYKIIESKISDEAISSSLGSGYKMLMTPAGAYMKKAFISDPLGLSSLGYKKIQKAFSNGDYKIIENRIFTADERNLIFFIKPTFPTKDSGKNSELVSKFNQIFRSVDSGVQVHYFGSPVVAAGNAERIKKDLNQIVTIIIVVLFLFLSLFYRSVYHFFILIIPVIFGAAVGLAVLYLVKGQVSSISLGIGAVLLGITIDYSLHIFTHFKKVKSAEKLLDDISSSLMMSCLTTIAAFVCLLFTDSEALRQLGLFASVSFLASGLSALIILPQVLRVPKSKKISVSEFKVPFGVPSFKMKPGLIFIIMMTISVIGWYLSQNLQFEKNLDALNYMTEDLKSSEEVLNRTSGVSLKSVFLVTKGLTLNDALEKLESISPLVDSLKAAGVVKKTTGVMPMLLSDKRIENKFQDWRKFWKPETTERVKQKIEQESLKLGIRQNAFDGFFAMLNSSKFILSSDSLLKLNKKLLSDYVSFSDSSVSIITILNVDEKDRSHLYESFAGVNGVIVFDKKYMSESLVNLLSENFNFLVNISLLLVFIILLVAYGRIELALITFLPILMSWYWTLGAMALLGLKINIVNIIVCTFVFGLGIDYSIFIMNGLIQKYAKGEQNLASFRTSIFLSGVTTIIGIGGMIFAQHPALRSIAGLSIIGICVVLILTNLFIPIAFNWLVSTRISAKFYPLTLRNILATLLAYVMLIFGFLIVTSGASLLYCLFFLPIKKRKYLIHYLLYAWAKVYIGVLFCRRKKEIDIRNIDFNKAGIIVANHQSFIDVPYLFSLSPKIILTTNDRIYNNPIFGPVSRLCDFLNVSAGIENMEAKIKQLTDNGYSIAVFPEGTRSSDNQIHRFHKGAFKIAKELLLPVIPIVIHGTGEFLPKGKFWGRRNNLTVKYCGPYNLFCNGSSMITYSEASKEVCALMRSEFLELKDKCAGPDYQRQRLILSNLYKSPLLEWYMKVKLKLEDDYNFMNRHLPKEGIIYDLGCGFGFSTFILGLSAEKRKMIGIDYDEFKINIAANNYLTSDKISFLVQDIQEVEFTPCNGIIFSDVLHYLHPDGQKWVLKKAMKSLQPTGSIIIKDGDSKLEKKQKMTWFTEFLSTRLLKFNKSNSGLNFLNSNDLLQLATENGFTCDELQSRKITSNKVWLLKPISR
jgi:1-acyl-sn-glycerol-3-phosphate acyltransferase